LSLGCVEIGQFLDNSSCAHGKIIASVWRKQ
jgi:hypothetical protein